jgi:hypothetical protein
MSFIWDFQSDLDTARSVDPADVLEYATMLCARIGPEFMLRWLNTKDDIEREMLQKISIDVIEEKEKLMLNQAIMIANEVGKMFSNK